MSDIFISYSSKNRARAKVLAGALERQGWSVWWDRKIPPGRQFSQVIKEAMDEARCVIVLWSKESVKSEWVQNEASEGASRNILVPALIDDVEIPFEFRRIQAARLVDWEGRSPHLEFDTLLEALCAILGQPLLPQRDSEVPPRAAYTITASGGAGGEISPSGEVPVNSGADQSFAITPEDGYEIADVVVDGASIGAVASHTFTNVTADHTIDASFAVATCTITASGGAGGEISPSGAVTVNSGADQSFAITPEAGYEIADVMVDGASVGAVASHTFTDVTADHTIDASFAIKTYSLTATAVDGSVTKSPDQVSYNDGDEVTLQAVADAGYTFTGWSGDLASSNNPATLVMDADKAVTASFAVNVLDHPKPTGLETEKAGSKHRMAKVLAAICIVALIVIVSIVVFLKYRQPKTYSLTATAGPNGSISPPGGVPVTYGGDMAFTAEPDEGYQIDTWSVDEEPVPEEGNTYTLSNIQSNHTVNVTFRRLEYEVTGTVGPNGSISLSEPPTVPYGGGMVFTAKPDEGYQIDTWSVDEEPVPEEGTTYKLSNIQSNHTVNVTFRRLKYEVTVTAGPNGSISPSVATTVTYGGDLAFTATPDNGYQIDTWTVDEEPVPEGDTTYTLSNIQSKHTVNVTFRRLKYEVTVTAGPNGSISPSVATTVTYGGDLAFTATPDNGYQIADVVVDGASVGAVASHTFTNVTADHTIDASFAVAAYTITASAGAGGAISPPGAVPVNSGADQSFTMTPETDYKIDDVVVDGASVGTVASHTFTNVTADHNIAASFADLKTGDVITNSIGMKLVYIRADSFTMGSSSSAAQLAGEYDEPEWLFTDEFPRHQVRISKGFWMGQTEVTQGQYKSVMNAQPWSGKDFVQESANNPAVYVSWDEAAAFCRELSKQKGKTYRLPTEAEWEYACQAGTKTQFSFGDNGSSLGDHAWFQDNAKNMSQEYGHPVGQKKPNPWGLYDMHGNVCEWCSDWYAKDYYSNSPSVDPNGPSSGASRSLRGGSWYGAGDYLRCSMRCLADPVVRGSLIGFRVVYEP